MKYLLLAIAFLFTLLIPPHSTAAKDLCTWPDAGYTISEYEPTGISKASYDQVLDKIERVFTSKLRSLGYGFRIHRSWSNGTINAQAWWTGNSISGYTCHIEMFGGMARFPGLTLGGFRQIALHEIGHCIAGYPYYSDTGKEMSVEGQADYWSTLVGCRLMNVGCRNSSLNVARALARMSGNPPPFRPVPPLPPVDQTMQDHPDEPCRLLTFDQGVLRGTRPRCWFKR